MAVIIATEPKRRRMVHEGSVRAQRVYEPWMSRQNAGTANGQRRIGAPQKTIGRAWPSIGVKIGPEKGEPIQLLLFGGRTETTARRFTSASTVQDRCRVVCPSPHDTSGSYREIRFIA
jgi:hypothetical protein